MILPYYKEMPYLPYVEGIVIDKANNQPIPNAHVYWENETRLNDSQTNTNQDGRFVLKMLSKYIKWKVVMMDPGWGGKLVIEKDGYVKIEKHIGGIYDPGRKFDINIVMEMVK
jgi:hypothetical protein